jgi:hypothetical protein
VYVRLACAQGPVRERAERVAAIPVVFDDKLESTVRCMLDARVLLRCAGRCGPAVALRCLSFFFVRHGMLAAALLVALCGLQAGELKLQAARRCGCFCCCLLLCWRPQLGATVAVLLRGAAPACVLGSPAVVGACLCGSRVLAWCCVSMSGRHRHLLGLNCGRLCTCPLHAHRLLYSNKLSGEVPSKWIPFLQGLYHWCLAAGCAAVAALRGVLRACCAFGLPGFVCHKSLPHSMLAAALLVGQRAVCLCGVCIRACCWLLGIRT